MIRYMYIYFIHRYTYIPSCIFISCLLSVLKRTSPLNSYSSPTPLLSSLDIWIDHPSVALRVLFHLGVMLLYIFLHPGFGGSSLVVLPLVRGLWFLILGFCFWFLLVALYLPSYVIV